MGHDQCMGVNKVSEKNTEGEQRQASREEGSGPERRGGTSGRQVSAQAKGGKPEGRAPAGTLMTEW